MLKKLPVFIALFAMGFLGTVICWGLMHRMPSLEAVEQQRCEEIRDIEHKLAVKVLKADVPLFAMEGGLK